MQGYKILTYKEVNFLKKNALFSFLMILLLIEPCDIKSVGQLTN
jgi:hypothetical protein